MRKHMLSMLYQHVNPLPQRLKHNPTLLYDYLPIPAVQHEALLRELWCHNYYLRNLCDAARFPDWTIGQPVELLKAVMEAWREEREKQKNADPENTDAQAYETLGVAKDATDYDIRQAYRSLARKVCTICSPCSLNYCLRVSTTVCPVVSTTVCLSQLTRSLPTHTLVPP